ncbi:RNA polymerase sigma factor [Lacibacter sp.]|uniref:RNA polymerase sigma factor n=1 Tax=Lacibacter sp. TaxID=1915409 RepID=UPI002B4B1BAA|nr:RNA polymerase sigma factor [Lacibacter sp.]HLP39491.1 RNA polymerase sigma factor [Lacibacter sp.]
MNETITISDVDLVKGILSGEKNLYTQIVRRYNQRLYRIGMSILNDDTEVEDAMQVAYINAYQSLGKFEFRASFSTWLTRILVNECFLRIKRRDKTIIMNDDNLEAAMQQQQSNHHHSPVTKVLNTELRNILDEAIRELPEIYRVVFVMREIENMNVAETQACLAINEVNVKVRLNRAKAMLRGLLSNYYNTEDILHFHLRRCDAIVEKVMANI